MARCLSFAQLWVVPEVSRIPMRKPRRLQLTPLLSPVATSQRLAVPWFVFLLCGCTVWSKSLPPYVLSDGETAIVEGDILSATKVSDKPPFHDLKAAKNNNGELYVCGWMNSNNKAYQSSEQAFIGTFSAGRFSPSRIGTNAESNAQVMVECQKLGMSIAKPSWDNGVPATFPGRKKSKH
jgi:hypothetical protein